MPSSKDIRTILTNELKVWGAEVSTNLDNSLLNALKKGGRTNPNATNLRFDYKIDELNGRITIIIFAKSKRGKTADYWSTIEDGRKKGKGVPNAPDNLGKDWQTGNNIDPRVVLLQMKAKKNGVSNYKRKFKKVKKTLDLEQSYKTLSYIISKSIKSKGIQPKPFLKEAINQNVISDLEKILREKLGVYYKVEFQALVNKYKTFEV